MTDAIDADAAQVILPPALDTAAAPGLADQLRMVRGGPVALKADEVRRVGGLCAQVLLSAAASWRADGNALTLNNPSDEFVEATRLMGLEPASFTAGDHTA
jgi:chemotaxis protein CheX